MDERDDEREGGGRDREIERERERQRERDRERMHVSEREAGTLSVVVSRFSCLQAIPVNIDTDVKTILLRLSCTEW